MYLGSGRLLRVGVAFQPTTGYFCLRIGPWPGANSISCSGSRRRSGLCVSGPIRSDRTNTRSVLSAAVSTDCEIRFDSSASAPFV
ncbi:hypothetical protein IG631_12417 [Alternaria alternata]|nr:hypothetical protein IG631_12417 [Alternaria alternata]